MNRAALDAKVLAWMSEELWVGDDDRFGSLALELFGFQFENCRPYRRFCEARGATPHSVSDWREIPAVPAGAFKEVALRSFPAEREIALFRTSGTSGGRRGELHLDTLAVYEASLLATIRRYLSPDLAAGERMRWIVLAPSAAEAPNSSLSHMFSCAVAALGTTDSGFFVRDGELARGELRAALASCNAPVALCGTAFAFVHLVENTTEELVLPPGSFVMETGGFKGRGREVPREELYEWIQRRLAVPRERIVNQYGMTELGSQFYDSVLAEPHAPRRKLGPPWARVRLLDPVGGHEVEAGEPGIITIHDLANTGSVAAVMTADLGVRIAIEGGEPGFDVLGREPGAEERGCSIAADLMLAG